MDSVLARVPHNVEGTAARYHQPSPGNSAFDILILSPQVVGAGLTFVEAHHVIHDGGSSRNRKLLTVYQIGQLKPVHVYYPIAKDPQREFGTLQEKLDTLLEISSRGGRRSSR